MAKRHDVIVSVLANDEHLTTEDVKDIVGRFVYHGDRDAVLRGGMPEAFSSIHTQPMILGDLDTLATTIRVANDTITAMRDGLRRLASNEAFEFAGVVGKETRIRMFYAEAILNGLTPDEAEAYAKEKVA